MSHLYWRRHFSTLLGRAFSKYLVCIGSDLWRYRLSFIRERYTDCQNIPHPASHFRRTMSSGQGLFAEIEVEGTKEAAR